MEIPLQLTGTDFRGGYDILDIDPSLEGILRKASGLGYSPGAVIKHPYMENCSCIELKFFDPKRKHSDLIIISGQANGLVYAIERLPKGEFVSAGVVSFKLNPK